MLRVQKLSKQYRTFASFGERALCACTLGAYAGSIRVNALEGLDLELGANGGEILGVIGANGAGKSTLLRLLAGNSEPTCGRIEFDGSVRSILELGVGFSQDLTGYENVYYNGRLWGYSTNQLMGQGMERILDFAQLHEFAHRPLKSYSTGMQMRLGFALAAYERCDLLLVDEALAVGDAAFQQKCISRFREFRDQGSVVIVVGHDLNTLRGVCDRMLLLDRGRAVAIGRPAEVVDAYMQLIADRSRASEARALQEREVRFELLDSAGRAREHFFTGDACRLRLQLAPDEDVRQVTVGIHLNDATGLRVFGTNTDLMSAEPVDFEQGRNRAVVFELKLNLGAGRYTAGFSVHRGRAHAEDCYIWQENPISFDVELPADTQFEGVSYLEPRFLPDAQ